MKKVLIKYNAELAEKRIEDVTSLYLNRMSSICAALRKIGVVDINHEIIRDLIHGNLSLLNDRERAIVEDSTNGGVLDDIAVASVGERITNVRNAVAALNTDVQIYNGTAINDDSLLKWFDFSEGGAVVLSEYALQRIRDDSSEYMVSKEGLEIRKLQEDAADILQKIYNRMNKIKNVPHSSLHPAAQKAHAILFPLHLFQYNERKDGKIIITPKAINFDAIIDDDTQDEQ